MIKFGKTSLLASGFGLLAMVAGPASAACTVDAGLKQRIQAAWAANIQPNDNSNTPTNRDASKLEEVFNPKFYLNKNPDVAQVFGWSDDAAITHWLDYGICEGRAGSPTFSVAAYRRYTDLQAALPNNNWAYLAHYFNYGAAEARCTVEDSEVPYSVEFSNGNTAAGYFSRGVVYANNAVGGLVSWNAGGDGGTVHVPCTGKLPNFTNVGYSVQIINFKFGGYNYFNQSTAGDHFGVLGASRAQLARNASAGMSGYVGQGAIFWNTHGQYYGVEGEIFSHRHVNGADSFATSTTEFPTRAVPNGTVPLFDTLDAYGNGDKYSATVKVKDGAVKYTVVNPYGQIVVNRTSVISASNPNPWADGITFFALCDKVRTGAACGSYKLRVEDISVRWATAAEF